MEKRDISLELLLDLIETGDVRHKSESDLWIFRRYPERADNDGGLDTRGAATMKMQYDDDILVIEFTNEKIVRDISLGWNVNVGMTANGVGEIVVLDAKAAGLFPLELSKELKVA